MLLPLLFSRVHARYMRAIRTTTTIFSFLYFTFLFFTLCTFRSGNISCDGVYGAETQVNRDISFDIAFTQLSVRALVHYYNYNSPYLYLACGHLQTCPQTRLRNGRLTGRLVVV